MLRRSCRDDIVGSADQRRGSFHSFELLVLVIEHSDPVATIFAEPEPVLRVHLAAARRRMRGRRLEEVDLAGLGVDAPDVPVREIGEVSVVFRIGDDVVDVMASRPARR